MRMAGTKVHHRTPTRSCNAPFLTVDELCLEVEKLDAKVSLQAEIKNLVNINVGVSMKTEEVELEPKNLKAQTLLKTHLDEVHNILNHTLDTLNNNPKLAARLLQSMKGAAGDLGSTIQENLSKDGTLDSATDSLKETIKKINSKPREAVENITEKAKS